MGIFHKEGKSELGGPVDVPGFVGEACREGRCRGRTLRASLLPPIPSGIPISDPGCSQLLVLLPRIPQGSKVQRQQNPWCV